MTLQRIRTGAGKSAEATASVEGLRGKGPQSRESGEKKHRTAEFQGLVTRMLDRADALWGEQDRLEDELGMGDPTNVATILGMMKRAEKNASDAHLLYVAAKVAWKDVEAQNETTKGAMWLKAKQALEGDREKHGGKAPTKDDIEAKVASMFPDEHRAQVNAEYQAKEAIGHLERLADLWKQRARTLEGMKP